MIVEGSCFEFEEHTADIIVVAWGETLEKAFECAALGVAEIMVNRETLEGREKRKVIVAGFDLENLLYRWIEEIIYLFDSHSFLVKEARVHKISEGVEFMLEGELVGDRYNPAKHEARTHVKAATYSLMKIIKEDRLWKVKFTVDI
ncbi:MAG: archease [Caldisericum exile]|uniref:Protein archease n=1 Tax=Caldisericum exile TaxID=693075 RepID=A0A2J6X423_9BACT|nr:MAG: archease [Caldisericum exile]